MFGITAVAAMALSLGAPAQDPPPQEATTLPDVVAERPLDEIVRSFVDEVADPLPGYGLARWDGRVCVRVAYLRRELAQYMVNRVSSVARDVGLQAGGQGCRPNVLVIAAADGSEMAQALVGARPGLFRTYVSGANRDRAELDEFQATDSPVRWWHISLPVDGDTGLAAVRLPGGGPAVGGNTYASRLRTSLRNDLMRVFIVVDFNQANGMTIRQLSDYVAMVALAQVDPDADTQAYDTVLNLFGPSPPPELTDWDRSYLNALYGAELDQTPNAQAAAVARVMARDRAQVQDGNR